MPDAALPGLLCTVPQFMEDAFQDLAAKYPATGLADIAIEATGLCEDAAGGRRLAPFTTTETLRATAVDPDEYAEQAGIPMSMQGSLGMSWSNALGATTLVRQVWVSNFPPRYPELWTYSDVSVQVILSYGGVQNFAPAQLLDGPDDTGHVWFEIGSFVPVGSRVRVTYSGGYTVSVPGQLVRAGRFMMAHLIARTLDPDSTAHDPDLLRADALEIMENWQPL